MAPPPPPPPCTHLSTSSGVQPQASTPPPPRDLDGAADALPRRAQTLAGHVAHALHHAHGDARAGEPAAGSGASGPVTSPSFCRACSAACTAAACIACDVYRPSRSARQYEPPLPVLLLSLLQRPREAPVSTNIHTSCQVKYEHKAHGS